MLYPPELGDDPLFPRAEDFGVIFKDDSTGCGVITYRSFPQGAIIAKIARNIVPDIRQHTLQISPTEHNFDPYFSGYFLHSCAPNVSVDMAELTITALVDIPAGSYLYMDYAETEDVLFKQFPCCCGAPQCRGWITGRLEVAMRPGLDAAMEADLAPVLDQALQPAMELGAELTMEAALQSTAVQEECATMSASRLA